MRPREPRFLTALAVIALCALAASRGWSIVQFVGAKAAVASHEAQPDALGRWLAVPGVAGAALEASVTEVAGPADVEGARKRLGELAAVLAVRPLSSSNWLSVASMRLFTGQPSDKVFAALAMSSITGPSEGAVMAQRGIFGLWQWETLPTDFRARAITDLAGAILGNTLSPDGTSSVVSILSAKAADVRQDLANQLRAQGVLAKDLGRLGLSLQSSQK